MRQLRRLLSAIFILLGAITVIPVFSGIASAHHSNITASVACSGTVSWTATSWSTGAEGTNPDIRVTKTVNGVTTQVGQGAFNPANNYQFSGTFAWPSGANSIIVTSTPNANWGNGNTSRTGSSVTVNKPSNCPGQPGVSKAVSCSNSSPGHGDGTVVLTLSNNASGPFTSDVSFKVYNPDQTTTFSTYTVAVGQTKDVTFAGLADGSHSVKITAGSTDLTQTFSVDCDSPIPSTSVTQTCANGDGQVVVTLTNAGGEAVVFDVTNPKTNTVEHVTVNADSSATRTFSGLADGNYTLVVKVGATDLSKSFTIDCKHPLPKVSSSVACDANHDGTVTITLANEGTEVVVFHVTNPTTNAVENVTVAAGASTTRTFGGFGDGVHNVAITADGFTGLSQTFTTNCDLAPTFSHAESCADGDGTVAVTMTNDGDDVNAVFVLDGTSYTVAPGATKVVTISGLADGSHLIPLTVNGADRSFTVTVDCDRPGQPAVEIAQSCADEDGLVIVTLKNIGGQLPLTFTVQGVDYQVAANSTRDVPVAGLLDGAQVIAISQGGTDFSKPVTISCDQAPTVGSSQSCVEGDNGIADGQVVVTLQNNGDDVAVTFTVNGTPYPVGPKQSQTVTISGLADGAHHVAVLAGTLDLGFDVTVACDHPGVGTLSVASTCVENDGQVTVTLIATGGELPVQFSVNGTPYSVAPNSTTDVVISGLSDGTTHITVLAGDKDLSFDTTTNCDAAPTYSYAQACSNFDDTVSVLIANPGDDVAVTFTINGTPYVLAPGESRTVLIDHLADGTNTITIAINGVSQNDIIVESNCDPVFAVTPICNTVDTSGEVAQYWFTVANSETTDVSVTWDGGSAVVPAGQSIVVGSSSAPLIVRHDGVEIARSAAAEATCERSVTFTKELHGQPLASETYSIRVSRLVGESYVEEMTFALNAGETKTINLPSTLDPAGIAYKIEEINAGTASTSTVSPDQLTLAGHLGETIAVVVTNGYASVQIDKTTSTASVLPGGQITYTLQAVNTGGLTLNPVVITDRLPVALELVSATVAGGECSLAQATRPQLVSCTMSGSLAPGASASPITIVAKVDATIAAGTTIVNQAMVHGAYTAGEGTETLAQKVNNAGSAGGDLSCLPVISGTVCDLSTKIGVPVTQIQVSPPTPATSTQTVALLPRTGAANLRAMLALGFGAVLLGGALLVSKRRLGTR